MSRDINPFGLRMQPDLRAAIEAACEETGRSMNAEISYRLQRSFETDSATQRKREIAVKELLEAAESVAKYWGYDKRNPTEHVLLENAIGDLEIWQRQLKKLDAAG